MNPGVCLHCGRKVDGRVNNIALTLYCMRCIHAVEFLPFETTTLLEIRQPWLWWESLAKKYCKGHPTDLAALHFEIASHRQTLPGPYERRYIAAEVRCLSQLPRERIAAEVRVRMTTRTERTTTLEKETGVKLESLNPYIRHFWLGDYLSGAWYTATDRDTVMIRYRVLMRVCDIIEFSEGVHPADAFQFCLKFPNGGVKEFQELKEKTRLVLQLQGFRILGLLEKRDIDRLEGSALHDVYVDYMMRDRYACIRGYLESMTGRSGARKILENGCCQQRLDEGRKRGLTDRDIARQLALIWKERGEPEERRGRLLRALAARGLSQPEGDRCCEAYIKGEGCLLLEELVRHVFLYHMVFV